MSPVRTNHGSGPRRLFSDALAAQAFDKNDIVSRGIIPLAVAIFNGNDFPVAVEGTTVELIHGEDHVRSAVQVIDRIRRGGERAAAGSVVGVHVRFDDARDAHSFRAGEAPVGVDVRLARVDDSAEPGGAAAKHVRSAAALDRIEGLEDHRCSLKAPA